MCMLLPMFHPLPACKLPLLLRLLLACRRG